MRPNSKRRRFEGKVFSLRIFPTPEVAPAFPTLNAHTLDVA